MHPHMPIRPASFRTAGQHVTSRLPSSSRLHGLATDLFDTCASCSANGWADEGGRGGRGRGRPGVGLAATLGVDDLDEDDEEELKFYEQLQVPKDVTYGRESAGRMRPRRRG